ncbi:MAG: glycoside hydrolase family 13 protein [Planctomycetota bacterium]
MPEGASEEPVHAADATLTASGGDIPAWAADACWYQVFVSRFCNGDPRNDPPHTHSWTADWLQPGPGEPEVPPKRTELFFRRYGGDLQGLLNRLPYLDELGVNALYLNPIFAAASEHKYDTSDYRHIDDTFGVAGARERLSAETADAATWQWSDSDRLFLDLLAETHRRGMRVVIDGVFNHVGRDFWAFRDVVDRGRDSPHAGWFEITDFGPPLQWNAWDGPNGHLVRFARTDTGLVPQVEDHLFAITRRWMDPNGDGDPSDGIDGWRLDAAEQVSHGFWKRWRSLVKSVNPQALILGEIWSNPRPWLAGDEFDVVTDYRFASAVIRFCRPGSDGCTATQFAAQLDALARQFDRSHSLAMINLLGSHDTDRVVSMLANPRRRYDRDNHPGAGRPPYDATRPGDEAYDRLRLAVVLQFTCPGAPLVYYGDEVGMYGADDPHCRAPMWWLDKGDPSAVGYRRDLFRFYREMIGLRSVLTPLRRGDFHVLLADDARRVIAFARTWQGERVVILINASRQPRQVQLTLGQADQPVSIVVPGEGSPGTADQLQPTDQLGPAGQLIITCPAREARLVVLGPKFSRRD